LAGCRPRSFRRQERAGQHQRRDFLRAGFGRVALPLKTANARRQTAFKDLKDDLSLRPIFHSSEQRIKAHIFVSFLACCLHVSLRACLRPAESIRTQNRIRICFPPPIFLARLF
jgi:hypothetical protein